MEFLSIRYSYVFMSILDEFLSELALELWGSSVYLYIFEVFIKFELIELFFLELFEGILDGKLGCEVY
jgi:hypothetical protein